MNSMDIDLSDLTRPSRVSEPAMEARDIAPGDLEALQSSRASDAPPRKRLRHKHHSLARALAGGMSPGQAAIVSGFALTTVSILQTDPAFIELVSFYTDEAGKTFSRIAEQQVRVASALLDDVERDVNDRAKLAKLPTQKKLDMALSLGLGTSIGVTPAAKTEVHFHANTAINLEKARMRAPPPIALPSRHTGSAGASPLNGASGSISTHQIDLSGFAAASPLTREAGASPLNHLTAEGGTSPLIDGTFEVLE